MVSKTLYVGVDVDDKAFHVSGFDPVTNERFQYKCKPTSGALLERLELLSSKGYTVKVCYESTYIGYSLYRVLISHNFHCDIIASSLIPNMSSARVKTDRIDSIKLATYYAKGLLTAINIPDEEDEQLRRLIRSRGFEVNSRRRLKQHILSYCRVLGVNYRESAENQNVHYWTVRHLLWLNSVIKDLGEIDYRVLEKLLHELQHIGAMIAWFDEKIEAMALTEKYSKKCFALNAFKGLQTLSSMTLISELGDIRRFAHPKKIVSYAGMDITEYSSGGKELKFGITKMGNRKIRTTLVEACQRITPGSTVGKQLRSRRKLAPPEIISIAERCQERLYKKKILLTMKHKHPNKVKTACAREMIGFIWEALRAVA